MKQNMVLIFFYQAFKNFIIAVIIIPLQQKTIIIAIIINYFNFTLTAFNFQ